MNIATPYLNSKNALSHIPLVKPSITKKEISYVNDAIKNGWGSKKNYYIEKFENSFTNKIGIKYGVSTSSCTGALHLGLAALGIKKGDEIIVPESTWIASVAPLVHLGAKPVFVDIMEDSWCIDPNLVENAITSKTNNPTQFDQSWGIIQSNFDNLFTTEKSIDQLKQTIVKLSIMGKLTFQDPKDEHPSELIKLITKEIANFSKVDELNKQISQSSIKKEAQKYPLPIGWISVRFGDIFTLTYGNNLPSEKRSETGEFPVFGSNGIVGTHNESCIDKPCIIVGRKGSAGALNLCLKNGCWVTDVAYSLVPPSSVNLEYVYLCLQSLDLNSLSKGIKPGLNRKEVYDLIISIPPLKEQQRIVIKVDQIMKLCERLKKNIISADTKKINFVDSVMEKICS